ncbi:probable alpha-mannosidase At5g13980 isoform X2 [Nymphaea colorata]|uniref:probable alpha-mannosidase At5g13980 isoform X2 n=1 Tax=Nymphaea colorata TaxID=210225 RepID=UPI00129E6B09|nr:probable alpha-mannosidase At5g13980 isoform X2 [Nymphaea colorata]
MMLRRGSLVMEVAMLVALALASASASALGSGEGAYIAYNTSQGIVEGKINVHLVAHTHDDVGWLKTVDQYYVGSNNSIQGACVQNVLDSVISALLADKNRKFIYVEQAFFQRWWRNQSPMVQKIVKELVDSGQLEFINGGMCMHDKAAPHYIDMIEQTTLGHRFIKEEFGKTPRIGWQIDPFGHSAVQAYLQKLDLIHFSSLGLIIKIDKRERMKKIWSLCGKALGLLGHPHNSALAGIAALVTDSARSLVYGVSQRLQPVCGQRSFFESRGVLDSCCLNRVTVDKLQLQSCNQCSSQNCSFYSFDWLPIPHCE